MPKPPRESPSQVEIVLPPAAVVSSETAAVVVPSPLLSVTFPEPSPVPSNDGALRTERSRAASAPAAVEAIGDEQAATAVVARTTGTSVEIFIGNPLILWRWKGKP